MLIFQLTPFTETACMFQIMRTFARALNILAQKVVIDSNSIQKRPRSNDEHVEASPPRIRSFDAVAARLCRSAAEPTEDPHRSAAGGEAPLRRSFFSEGQTRSQPVIEPRGLVDRFEEHTPERRFPQLRIVADSSQKDHRLLERHSPRRSFPEQQPVMLTDDLPDAPFGGTPPMTPTRSFPQGGNIVAKRIRSRLPKPNSAAPQIEPGGSGPKPSAKGGSQAGPQIIENEATGILPRRQFPPVEIKTPTQWMDPQISTRPELSEKRGRAGVTTIREPQGVPRGEAFPTLENAGSHEPCAAAKTASTHIESHGLARQSSSKVIPHVDVDMIRADMLDMPPRRRFPPTEIVSMIKPVDHQNVDKSPGSNPAAPYIATPTSGPQIFAKGITGGDRAMMQGAQTTPPRRRFPPAELLPSLHQAEAGMAGQNLTTVCPDDAFQTVNPAARHFTLPAPGPHSPAKESPRGGLAIIKGDAQASPLRRHFPPTANPNLIHQVEQQIAAHNQTDLGPEEGTAPSRSCALPAASSGYELLTPLAPGSSLLTLRNGSSHIVPENEARSRREHIDSGPSIPALRTQYPVEHCHLPVEEGRENQRQQNWQPLQNEMMEIVPSPLAEGSPLSAVVPLPTVPSEESPSIRARVLFHHFLYNVVR